MINIQTKPGYVYLLKNTLLGGYKIGITTSPSSRFKALAVGEKTEIVGYWQTDNYRELEKYYHSEYKAVRCPQSEWFNLEEADVTAIVNQMHSSAMTQYLDPQRQAEFIGAQFNFANAVDLNPQDKTWNYFAVLVIVAAGALLVGMQM
jgi:hypothetical protein